MQIPVDEELIHYWYTFVYTVYTIIMIMIVFVYMIIIITSWRLIDLRKSYDIIVAIKNFKLHVCEYKAEWYRAFADHPVDFLSDLRSLRMCDPNKLSQTLGRL